MLINLGVMFTCSLRIHPSMHPSIPIHPHPLPSAPIRSHPSIFSFNHTPLESAASWRNPTSASGRGIVSATALLGLDAVHGPAPGREVAGSAESRQRRPFCTSFFFGAKAVVMLCVPFKTLKAKYWISVGVVFRM